VTKEDQVERAVKETVETFGRIDYAANFAGIIGPLKHIWETDLDQWRKVIEVNTIGVWICNKYEMKQMMQQDSIQV
jgi:NAD(P)-dependent dehydrogenase (short-subunit alcohol dehydrogenase family)